MGGNGSQWQKSRFFLGGLIALRRSLYTIPFPLAKAHNVPSHRIASSSSLRDPMHWFKMLWLCSPEIWLKMIDHLPKMPTTRRRSLALSTWFFFQMICWVLSSFLALDSAMLVIWIMCVQRYMSKLWKIIQFEIDGGDIDIATNAVQSWLWTPRSYIQSFMVIKHALEDKCVCVCDVIYLFVWCDVIEYKAYIALAFTPSSSARSLFTLRGPCDLKIYKLKTLSLTKRLSIVHSVWITALYSIRKEKGFKKWLFLTPCRLFWVWKVKMPLYFFTKIMSARLFNLN
mgnify:FL=1